MNMFYASIVGEPRPVKKGDLIAITQDMSKIYNVVDPTSDPSSNLSDTIVVMPNHVHLEYKIQGNSSEKYKDYGAVYFKEKNVTYLDPLKFNNWKTEKVLPPMIIIPKLDAKKYTSPTLEIIY
jgi:hypothetical protein